MKIIIYTPTYQKSPGIRYRVDMMRKALEEQQFEILVLCDMRELALRKAYELFGPCLLSHKWVWEKAGERIARLIISEKPDAAILISDVTAGAIPFLRKKGVFTVLSIEDLSAEWLAISNKKSISQILLSYSTLSDEVIAVSSKLQHKLADIGIEARVVPPGLERVHVSPEEAREREKNTPVLLHSGQIQFKEEKLAFESVIRQVVKKYPISSYSQGKFVDLLGKEFPELAWYNYPTSDDAIHNLKSCSIGLIIRFRAHNPTRIYFHASMLQPVIAIGDNWVDEVTNNRTGVSTEPEGALDAMDKIVNNYSEYVQAVQAYAEGNTLRKAYEPLIKVFTRN